MIRSCWILGVLFIVNLTTANPIKSGSIQFEQNPEEIGGFFEGDLDLSEEQFLALRARNGLISKSRRWPNKTVLYKIGPEFDSARQSRILDAIKILESKSCLRFKEATASDKYYINITGTSTGCHSQVGFHEKVRRMNLEMHPLDTGCFRVGSILHEFLHTLGFYHQQSASDREGYVKIIEENIQPGMEDNFQQQSDTENFGIPYDYDSVLHYSSLAFSKNGKKTIVTLDPKAEIGQRQGLSVKDIDKLNIMYLCPIQT